MRRGSRMLKIKEAVVVEGRYDKNALRQIVDAVIIETAGFGLFNDREKQQLLRVIAKARGLIVLTDSDAAGFVIRSFIRSCVDPELVKHAYIPDVPGKERRKSAPSKEGKLGVEGMPPQVLLDALLRAGATVDDSPCKSTERPPITKADLYARGLSGRENSRQLRKKLLRQLELPERLTSGGLLEVLNTVMSREEFFSLQL